jgi:hypothetical protein
LHAGCAHWHAEHAAAEQSQPVLHEAAGQHRETGCKLSAMAFLYFNFPHAARPQAWDSHGQLTQHLFASDAGQLAVDAALSALHATVRHDLVAARAVWHD